MAIDRALAASAEREDVVTCRLYRWKEDSISFGANEAARRSWDRERLERLELPCVRRPTGGRGVWHGRDDLTYAVTAPLRAFGTLRLAYRIIHEQLRAALCRLGIDASIAPSLRRPTLEPGACFDLAVGGEVLVSGRKTIGSAQALIGSALLQHGAIACADGSARLARFRLGSASFAAAEPSGDALPTGAVAESILATWRDDGGTPLTPVAIDHAERASAEYASHFRNADWTWRR